MDEVVPLAIEMKAIGFHPGQPVRLLQHGSVQWQEGDVGVATGFGQHGFMGRHILIALPETVRKGHDVLIHWRQTDHQHLRLRFHLVEQLPHAEAIGLKVQLLASIRPTHPCGVVQSDG